MRLDLRDVLNTPGETVERQLCGELTQLEDVTLTSPVHGLIRATNSRKMIVVEGRVSATVQLQCSRCLREFESRISANVEASCPTDYFRSLIDEVSPEEEPDEETLMLFDATSLDVNELVRQSLLLEMPIQPLCKKECKGLCPSCGMDLNLGQCACLSPADARWNKLASWIDLNKHNSN